MNTKTIMTPDFMDRAAKIIADEIDTEVIKESLQGLLSEYCTSLNGYYEEEYYNAVASARSKAYDDGHSDGYDDGYDAGCADCHAKYGY